VEIPIEQIAVVQKRLMQQVNLLGKPVITATQMLESMTTYRRPTRAEAMEREGRSKSPLTVGTTRPATL